jgi:hypothetical protein
MSCRCMIGLGSVMESSLMPPSGAQNSRRGPRPFSGSFDLKTIGAPMLLMLEDDNERFQRFTSVLRAIAPEMPFQVWRDAKVMIREVGPHLPAAQVISLDHDLDPVDGGPDPGDGLEVVKYLVAQPFVCPVIIHTSNRERSTWMEGEFDLAGWPHWRVAPLGDDWIEVDWRRLVKRLLKKAGRNSRCT